MYLDGFNQIASLMSGAVFIKLHTTENVLGVKPLESTIILADILSDQCHNNNRWILPEDVNKLGHITLSVDFFRDNNVYLPFIKFVGIF